MNIELLNNKEILIGGFQRTEWQYPLVDFRNCPLYTKSDKFIKYFYKKIIDSIYKFDCDITLQTFHEILPIWNQKILDRAVFVSDIFKEEGLGNKLYFKDNSLNFTFRESINHISSPYLLGFNSDFNLEISPRYFEKKFLYLNRKNRTHRELFFSMIKNTNIISNSYYSYNSISSDLPEHKKIEFKGEIDDSNIWVKKELTEKNNWDFFGYGYGLIDEYSTSFCNIVTESQSNTYWNRLPTNQIIITEKTEKCFVAGQPFVIVGNFEFLSTLKKLGFKTFDKWWDESYDLEVDELKRFEKIKKVLLDISSWDYSKCESVYKEMIPILKHNQELNNKWNLINRKRQPRFPRCISTIKKIDFEI